jgi:hypothetical protein
MEEAKFLYNAKFPKASKVNIADRFVTFADDIRMGRVNRPGAGM